ncbi:syntaxin-52-like protein isoform X3, partial [Tanacetum coccineum]
KEKEMNRRRDMLTNMRTKVTQMASTLNMSNFANRNSLPDGLYSGIVGLQRQIMREQDEGVGKSEETVISTKHIALAVNEELTLHTRLINDLDEHVDVTDSRLKMMPHEVFSCPCARGNVVVRESHQPHTRGKLYYACPLSKPWENDIGCKFFLWKEERVRLLAGSPGASTTPIYSPGPSTPPSYSPGLSRNVECSNCKFLVGKIKVLEATLEMYMHPENHTLDSIALLHELYNEMGKIGLE